MTVWLSWDGFTAWQSFDALWYHRSCIRAPPRLAGRGNPLAVTLREKIESLPSQPGVYLFRDALGTVVYVGKARALRARVRSYVADARASHPKTDALMSVAADLSYIVVDNEREALALENNLIKEHKPKFNILLRDDKTYPYIKFTAGEKFPRVYVTRRLKKDGSIYYGPYFPASLAYRIVRLIHKWFKVPSCNVDLTRAHPRPCLEYYIHRCHGPCVPGLVTDERYAEAARDVRLFLEGRRSELGASLSERMQRASDAELYEEAAALRDLLHTLADVEERQKMAAAQGDDTDVLAWHAEPPLAAVNLFHLRGGRVVDRRDFYWEDLEAFSPEEFLPALLKQIYLDSAYQPRYLHVPLDFEDRELLEEILSERAGHRVEIAAPQRGQKRALVELVEKNAKLSFEQRFRVLKPTSKAIVEALESALGLPEKPRRIECFDVSHIQGTDKVASLVVWEDGKLRKGEYRKFIIREVAGNDDFASIREAVERRYRRLRDEKKAMPGLILIDGGVGQLHAAAQALEALGIINQPLASIAKKEEILYVFGQENEPVTLDRHSPILHLVQQIRDETHRFAVTFHRQRRGARQRQTELLEAPGIGTRTAQKLLRHFGSAARVREASVEQLSAVINRPQAERLAVHFRGRG
jgi:excinuclease ABC subunit C